MAKRNTRRRRYRRKNMRGGAFSPDEFQILSSRGLEYDQIETLQTLGISFDEIMQTINEVMNQGPDGFHGNSDDMAEQVMSIYTNETPINVNPIEDDDDSFETQGTMNIDELNESNDTDISGYTTEEDINGGKKHRRTKKKRITKKRISKKGRKSRKNKKLNQKAGTCYGSGVGANSYDPNYSIYNTNMLKLFPYKST
jgi:hypothetical protein